MISAFDGSAVLRVTDEDGRTATAVAGVTVTRAAPTIVLTSSGTPSAPGATITGEALGLVGRVSANAELELSEAGPHQTDIRYAANVGLTGKLGGLGEPVFRAKSAEVAKDFAANLKAAIEQTTFKASL